MLLSSTSEHHESLVHNVCSVAEEEYTSEVSVWVVGDSAAVALYPPGRFLPSQVGLGSVERLPALHVMHVTNPLLSCLDLYDVISNTIAKHKKYPEYLVIHAGAIDANPFGPTFNAIQIAISRTLSSYNDICSLAAPNYVSPHSLQSIIWSTPLPRQAAPLSTNIVNTIQRVKLINAHARIIAVREHHGFLETAKFFDATDRSLFAFPNTNGLIPSPEGAAPVFRALLIDIFTRLAIHRT